MKRSDIIVVRIYLTESSNLLNKIVTYLKNEAHISGVSVFRAISGYGQSGEHTSSFIDLSLDLPIVIEFFDKKAKVESVLTHVSAFVKPEHIIFWDAQTNA